MRAFLVADASFKTDVALDLSQERRSFHLYSNLTSALLNTACDGSKFVYEIEFDDCDILAGLNYAQAKWTVKYLYRYMKQKLKDQNAENKTTN